MEKAKAAVSDFMSKSGHHDTTVHERVQPAVTHETVKAQKHENVTTALDKEVHQDHYHTAVQPVQDREVLAEKHHHNLVGVEHRQFEHGNEHEVQERLRLEAAKFKDQSVRAEEAHTRSAGAQIAGEHVHHHVHETIQPIVQKETIEPHVVHTTVPIHEVHHNAAQHHSTSALPAVSMADFKRQGGVLTGREERYDGFEGEPRHIGGGDRGGLQHTLHGAGHHGGAHAEPAGALRGEHAVAGDHGRGTGNHGLGGAGAATAAAGVAGAAAHHHHEGATGGHSVGGTHFDRDGRATEGTAGAMGAHSGDYTRTGVSRGDPTGVVTGATGAGVAGAHHKRHGSGSSSSSSSASSVGKKTTASTKSKPSLLDRLNPMKDTDNDGKKGIMD